MENYREVTVLDNSDRSNRNSLAREKYRYLNSSHRNSRGGKQTYRTSERENYYGGHTSTTQSGSVDEEKIAREFRRLMISTAIVGFAVFVKVFDFGIVNTIEDKFRSSLQTTSQIDNKISDSMVSFGQKVGINLDEISNKGDKVDDVDNLDNANVVTDINTDLNTDANTNVNAENNVIDDTSINNDNISTNTNSTDVTDGASSDNGIDIADEQISDFYIDDEILESVFEDGKK